MADDATIETVGDRKAKKVRSAWLSFFSRILAQIVGAAATVVFGLMFLQAHMARTETEPVRPAVATPAVVTARAPQRSGQPSIAVLPLEDLSTERRPVSVANAMTESLIAALSRVEGLRVISRTSSMHYQGTRKTVPEIARELRVNWILEGSVVVADGRVRIIGQLIDGASDEHAWTATFDRKLQGLLTLQSDLASAMAGEIEGVILGAKHAAAASLPPVAPTSGTLRQP